MVTVLGSGATAALLAELLPRPGGPPVRRPGPPTDGAPRPAGTPIGPLPHGGDRFYVLDLAGMPPLYLDLYPRIFARRLELWGAGSGGTVGRSGTTVVFGGPEEGMRVPPREVAARRLRASDEQWVRSLDRRWRAAAHALEQEEEVFWSDLVGGSVSSAALRSVLRAKIELNALGVDALIPSPASVEEELMGALPGRDAREVTEASYLPTSGAVAYDVPARECWVAARAYLGAPELPEPARVRFIHEGLFYTYESLDTDRRAYWLEEYPRTVARRHAARAGTRTEIDARLGKISDRSWRRRLHRQWARRCLSEAVGGPPARRRLLLLHDFLGSAREFDEEKRRRNMPLWRSLFALADGLGVSLASTEGSIEGLCAAIDRRAGSVRIDPVFVAAQCGVGTPPPVR